MVGQRRPPDKGCSNRRAPYGVIAGMRLVVTLVTCALLAGCANAPASTADAGASGEALGLMGTASASTTPTPTATVKPSSPGPPTVPQPSTLPSSSASAGPDVLPPLTASFAAGPVSGTRGPVPWQALPYRPVSVSPPKGSGWCRAADLVAAPPPADSPGFDVGISLTLHTRAARTCALQGEPALALSNGNWTMAAATTPGDFVAAPVNVVSMDRASRLTFDWSGPACSGRNSITITVQLPHDGGTLAVPWTTAYACPPTSGGAPATLVVSPLGQFDPYGDGTLDNMPFITHIIDQHTVRRGAILHYRIMLSHMRQTGTAAGPPCYGYRETLVDVHTFAVLASEVHQLPCEGVPPLDRFGTEWEEQIGVPATLAPGTLVEIGWQCTVPGCQNEASAKSEQVLVTG